jgi:hypothetical protein
MGTGRACHRLAGRLSLVFRRRPRQQAVPNVRAPSRRERHHAQLGDRPQIAGRRECASVDRRAGNSQGTLDDAYRRRVVSPPRTMRP